MYDTMELRDVMIRFGERDLSAPEIDEVNSQVHASTAIKKLTLFLADNGPSRPARSRNSISYAAARSVRPSDDRWPNRRPAKIRSDWPFLRSC